MELIYRDKTYMTLFYLSGLSSIAAFYFLHQFLLHVAIIWIAPMFIPIYFYSVLVFTINLTLSFIAYKKYLFLSYAFNFLTFSVNLLILLALILNIKNPNG